MVIDYTTWIIANQNRKSRIDNIMSLLLALINALYVYSLYTRICEYTSQSLEGKISQVWSAGVLFRTGETVFENILSPVWKV